GHPDRSVCLNNLAFRLSTRYKQLGAMGDLNEAIVLDRDALALCPPGHPDRSTSLGNLAVHLSTRYNQLGAMEDLNEAIILNRNTLALRPPGHPDQSMSLNNLAGCLSTRYKQLGAMEDLNEAIVLNRDALALRPPGHPDRSMSLNNLAADLFTRYNQLGAMGDLNEAIVLDRDALALRPPGHPHRSMSLNNLALCLSTRYNQLGAMEDLDEAIVLDRDTLVLCPLGHPNRSTSLNNLAVHLSTRYNQLGAMEDLDEAIALNRDALALRPPGHPDRSRSLNNLALCLSTRYNQLRAMEDLNEAIVLDRDALVLRPPGHPDRSESLQNLARYLRTWLAQSSQLSDTEQLFTLYATLAHAPPMVSSTDLSAARAWIHTAEHFRHSTTPLAYDTYLRLLIHHLASLPSLPQHLTILKNLTSSLAVDAFSACLRHHSPINAVELLEQGRGVFWSQLARLRSPLDAVIASGPPGKKLADDFIQLALLIHNALDSPGPDQHDRVCRLNVQFQEVVMGIRGLPGLSRFLLPLLFSDLQQAAREGPVIIVNASEYGCDALVVLVDQNPVHIPLSITKRDVGQLSSKLSTLTVRAKSMDMTRDLGILLRDIWDQVVSPIVDFLQTIHPSQSRIWWCPTAEFSLLPLHAAGPYRKGQQNLSDLYISSYTPTLTALIRARRHNSSNSATRSKHFVGIGQANAIGQSELVSVGAELANIGHCVDGLATFTRVEGQESCISRVTEELGKNDWVHLACHGLPNQKQPFESAFALHDGHFTIQRIMRCELENPQFAYLSACHTTVGDEESPDEVIHLASAMQFAGFRSVIGTMWAVDDGQTNKITSMFYDHMVDKSGRLDHTRAAFALHKTMKKVDIPFDQRILYVHLGA
ncbi:TPR-like protein, partial [Lanmaoa asiatica]